tara:strand:+ start:250 stop:573 length:324 start_codon:yes stop_codon:yes gene_type:complete
MAAALSNRINTLEILFEKSLIQKEDNVGGNTTDNVLSEKIDNFVKSLDLLKDANDKLEKRLTNLEKSPINLTQITELIDKKIKITEKSVKQSDNSTTPTTTSNNVLK